MNKIGIIYTTFLRPNLVKKTLPSVLKYSPKDSIILIGDQSHKLTKNKESLVDNPRIHYYILPFDYGISASRNFLIQKAYELGCDFILLTADNIEFTSKYSLTPIIEFLENDVNNGIVAFELKYKWEYNLEIENKEFVLIKNNEPITFEGITYYKYDLVKQFFLAKTKVLLDNKWDSRLKVTEHLDFFWRLKNKTSYKAYYTSIISAHRIKNRPKEYLKYRNRQYTNEFRKIVKEKWGLTGWIRGRK